MTATTSLPRAQFYDYASPGVLSKYHLSEQEIAGLFATETCHPPGFRIPRHAHNLTSFYLVLQGSLTEFCGRTKRDCRTHSVTFTPSGEIHGNIFHDAGGRCFLVELTSGWDERLSLAGVEFKRGVGAENSEVTQLATRLYKEFRNADSLSPLSVEGLGLEILAAFSRQSKQQETGVVPGWLRQAKELLHDRFSETISLDEIAGHTGVHPVHLARTFRKHYRCSIGEYQRRLRVENASRQLMTSSRPLADIALFAGFADQAHFSRVFKSHTGLTPAKFRAHFNRG